MCPPELYKLDSQKKQRHVIEQQDYKFHQDLLNLLN